MDADRIHIVGGPGSVKSTLALRLGRELGVQPCKLDELAYESGTGAKQPPSIRAQSIEKIVAKPDWITEGVYLWWTKIAPPLTVCPSTNALTGSYIKRDDYI